MEFSLYLESQTMFAEMGVDGFQQRLGYGLVEGLVEDDLRQETLNENAVFAVHEFADFGTEHLHVRRPTPRLLLLSADGSEIVDFEVAIDPDENDPVDMIGVRRFTLEPSEWEVRSAQNRRRRPGTDSLRRRWTFRHLATGHEIRVDSKRRVSERGLGQSDEDDFARRLASKLGWPDPR